MTLDELAAIAARAAAATKGPWPPAVWCDADVGGWAAVGPHLHPSDDEGDPEGSPLWRQAMLDAVFLANARDDVPMLLSEIERLRALVQEA